MNERLLSPSFRLLLAASSLSLPLLFAGCAGYKLGENKPTNYTHIENIYVPTFHNETLEPRLSVLVTNAVITQLQQDGTYKITNKEDADAVLVGTIRQIRRYQQRSTQTEVLKTRELLETIQIDFRLEDPSTGESLSRQDPFGLNSANRLAGNNAEQSRGGAATGTTSIFLDKNFELSERQGLALAAQDAAEQLVSRITEGW